MIGKLRVGHFQSLESFVWACIGYCLLSSGFARGSEPHPAEVVNKILQTREAILRQEPAPTNCVFVAIWDLDGTILKGDCSEGLREGDHVVYPGLAQVAIEQGLSALYPRDGGFARFWTDYTNMDARVGHWLAYPFIPQMLRGARAEDVLNLSRRHFADALRQNLFASSLAMMRGLERGGVELHVISASADVFVKGAAAAIGVSEHRIHGIEVKVRDGLLTEELVYPVTWNVGKREKLESLVRQMKHERPSAKVFVLAGFGDSYTTDGPFLKFIATQTLPSGKPLAVFINSKGEPDDYRGLFLNVSQSETAGTR